MSLFGRDALKAVLTPSTGWCVSLCVPTHRTWEDTRQDPIRFKNLLRLTNVTPLYRARDTAHNNAVALKEYVEKTLEAALDASRGDR
jgi:hypothetical protein